MDPLVIWFHSRGFPSSAEANSASKRYNGPSEGTEGFCVLVVVNARVPATDKPMSATAPTANRKIFRGEIMVFDFLLFQ
jgi:hypothetical protein